MKSIFRYFSDIIIFIDNCVKYRKALTQSCPWDSHGMFLFLRDNLQQMYDYQSNVDYFVSVNRDKHCNKMKVCIALLDRVIKDEYHDMYYDFDSPLTDEGLCSKLPFKTKYYGHQKENDVELLFHYLNKYSLHWWH